MSGISGSSVGSCQNQHGTTLVEIMMACVISLITMGAACQVGQMQNRVYELQAQILESQQTAKILKDMVVRELTMAGYRPVGGPAFFGVTYDPAQLRIRADLNASGTVGDGNNEDITYRFDATNLRVLRISGGRQTVVPGVQSFTFAYRDANGNTTTVSALIREVAITLVTRTARPDHDYPLNKGYRTFTLQFRVAPINLSV